MVIAFLYAQFALYQSCAWVTEYEARTVITNENMARIVMVKDLFCFIAPPPELNDI
jgi:hypothetical protein